MCSVRTFPPAFAAAYPEDLCFTNSKHRIAGLGYYDKQAYDASPTPRHWRMDAFAVVPITSAAVVLSDSISVREDIGLEI